MIVARSDMRYTHGYTDLRKLRYLQHKRNAATRRIPFLLTFDQWWGLWVDSGKWEQRGPLGYQYCMSRFGDEGPYSLDNVVIRLNRENRADRCRKYKLFGESNAAFGKDYWATHSENERASRAASISKKMKGRPKSAATRKRMSEAAYRRHARARSV